MMSLLIPFCNDVLVNSVSDDASIPVLYPKNTNIIYNQSSKDFRIMDSS